MPQSAFALRPSKPLDQMNSLRDMSRFPVPVHAGATLNVLLSIACTLFIFRRFAQYPLVLPAWIGLVLLLNLAPVVLLRAAHWRATAPMPAVEQMNFFGDQHRFADWVYLAASANMAFWIALSWAAYTLVPAGRALPTMLLLAALCTLLPVWLRPLRQGSPTGGSYTGE